MDRVLFAFIFCSGVAVKLLLLDFATSFTGCSACAGMKVVAARTTKRFKVLDFMLKWNAGPGYQLK